MAAVLLAGVAALAACDGIGAPRLKASWDGSRPGRLGTAAGTAWCPRAGRLEINAIRGDMGVGLVIYPTDSLVEGAYEAFDPGLFAMQRPGVAAALRWFTEQEVRGYQSDSGSAQLLPAKEGYSLSFGFRMVGISPNDTLRLRGQVSPVTPGACPADRAPEPPDSE